MVSWPNFILTALNLVVILPENWLVVCLVSYLVSLVKHIHLRTR